MRFLTTLGLLCFSSALALAQQSATPPITDDNSKTTTPPANAKQSEDAEMKAEESKRLVGMVPMFGVTSRPDARPLTSSEKFHIWEKSTFDPFVPIAVGFQAGISQWQNEFPAYGQGAAGYGKRFGAALADGMSSGFFSNAVYPVLLHEDPRFFRLGQGSFGTRFKHALLQEFVCRTDSRGRSFNFSNVFGAFTTGGISNIYYPPSDRGFELTMSRSAISLAYGSAGGLFSEFGPDLEAKILHRKPKPMQ